MPNFLVIGAAKSGSTSLYAYLKQHPQIYMSPVKEPGFFAWEGDSLDFRGPGDRERTLPINNLKEYVTLFDGVTNEIAIGEACTDYLYSSQAPERICHYIPDAKLVAILRDPTERAFSQFLGNTKGGYEPLTNFAQAIAEEDSRISNNWHYRWHYRARGFYYTQLMRYLDEFDRSQLKIYFYEDWNANPIKILQDIFLFLGVDNTFIPDISTKLNTAPLAPKNKILDKLLQTQNPIKSILKPFFPKEVRTRIWSKFKNQNLAKPTLSPAMRQQLIQVYREDILKLQGLLQRDLSRWLQ